MSATRPIYSSLVVDGELIECYKVTPVGDAPYYVNRFIINGEHIIFFGNPLGKPGQNLHFNARVKSNHEFRGQRSTIIAWLRDIKIKEK